MAAIVRVAPPCVCHVAVPYRPPPVLGDRRTDRARRPEVLDPFGPSGFDPPARRGRQPLVGIDGHGRRLVGEVRLPTTWTPSLGEMRRNRSSPHRSRPRLQTGCSAATSTFAGRLGRGHGLGARVTVPAGQRLPRGSQPPGRTVRPSDRHGPSPPSPSLAPRASPGSAQVRMPSSSAPGRETRPAPWSAASRRAPLAEAPVAAPGRAAEPPRSPRPWRRNLPPPTAATPPTRSSSGTGSGGCSSPRRWASSTSPSHQRGPRRLVEPRRRPPRPCRSGRVGPDVGARRVGAGRGLRPLLRAAPRGAARGSASRGRHVPTTTGPFVPASRRRSCASSSWAGRSIPIPSSTPTAPPICCGRPMGNAIGGASVLFGQRLRPDGLGFDGEPVRLLQQRRRLGGAADREPCARGPWAAAARCCTREDGGSRGYATGYASCDTPPVRAPRSPPKPRSTPLAAASPGPAGPASSLARPGTSAGAPRVDAGRHRLGAGRPAASTSRRCWDGTRLVVP